GIYRGPAPGRPERPSTRAQASVSLAAREAQRTDAFVQVGALHAEGARRARHIPSSLFERSQDMLALGRFARLLHARSRAIVAGAHTQLERYRGGGQHVLMREDCHPLHSIAQFTRIARPFAGFERIPHFGMKALPAETIARAEIVEEILRHGTDILR